MWTCPYAEEIARSAAFGMPPECRQRAIHFLSRTITILILSMLSVHLSFVPHEGLSLFKINAKKLKRPGGDSRVTRKELLLPIGALMHVPDSWPQSRSNIWTRTLSSHPVKLIAELNRLYELIFSLVLFDGGSCIKFIFSAGRSSELCPAILLSVLSWYLSCRILELISFWRNTDQKSPAS